MATTLAPSRMASMNLAAGHVHAQVDDLIARALEHHGHEVFADVVQVTLGGADRHLAVGLSRPLPPDGA